MPPNAVQSSATAAGSLVEPHRYLRLGDLASAIRNAGHSCEVIRGYKQIKQIDNRSVVYNVDCLEYSYRLTIENGKGRIERSTRPIIRE